nr:uncharacterized protein LOC109174777 [Ipomoea batatas]
MRVGGNWGLNEMASGSRVQSSARSISGSDGGTGSKRSREQEVFGDSDVTRSGLSAKVAPRTFDSGMMLVPDVVVTENTERALTATEIARSSSFNTRWPARDLVPAMQEFNARQRQAVRDIGMTGILGLEITDTPLTLGQWLVSNFKPMDCSLQLGLGRIVEITREDVAATIGLPLGTREIVCRPSQKVSKELRAWRAEMGKRDCTITQKKMFYIDRVVVGDRVIPRGIPAFVGWTSKLLRELEVAEIRGGGFGMGTLDIPLRETGFVERFVEKSKLLAATVVELVQMVKDAPEHTYNDINFKVVLEAAEKLLRMARDGIQAPIQPCTQHDDSFWANPDNIAAVEEIENAIVMKQGLMDKPSFSLGLTQTPVMSPGRGVQDSGCPSGLRSGWMFFFPMSHAQHYFVLCVDMRNRKLEIIDSLAESDRTSDIYGEILKKLKDLLSSYLEKKGHPIRAATVRNLKPTRLRIGWRDCQNNVDCAAYAMRHMETFMGRPNSRWDCDLENGNRQLLRKLRQKYLHDILMADVNAHKEWIMERTTEYDNRIMGRSGPR